MSNKSSIFAKSYTDQAKQHAFRELLSSNERAYLVEHSRVRSLATGDTLCQQNKLESELFVILMGEVEVIEEVDGKQIRIGKLRSGDLVGEIGALFGVPRIASVMATTPAVVLEISASEFTRLIDKTPNLHGAVYQQLYERSLETALCSSAVQHDPTAAQNDNLSRVLRCWKVDAPN